MNLLLTFTIVQLVNVVLNTIKSVLTVKGGKLVASLANAITYGFYTVVVVMTASEDISLTAKILITIGTNLIGVWVGLWVLEKLRKDKLWQIVATIKFYNCDHRVAFENELQDNKISYNCNYLKENEISYNLYSYSKQDSDKIKPLLKQYNAKYIVLEESTKL